MPKKAGHVPAYKLHKPSGQARAIVNGKHVYLGRFGSEESQGRYGKLVAELAVAPILPVKPAAGLTVAELLARFWTHAEQYYRNADGSPSSEVHNLKLALRPLRRLYGQTPAAGFGPLALQAVRQAMVDDGLVRTSINRHVGRVKLVFKWGVANELLPPSVFHGLVAVAGLRAGRCQCQESEPVKPARQAYIDAALPFLTAPVAAMVQLQLFTAMRPGEVVRMRGCDLDTSGRIWLYKPAQHKTAYRGHERTIYLGPRAQVIVKQFLKAELEAPLFSPKDSIETHLAARRAARKSPMTPSQRARKRKSRPTRTPQDRYTIHSYCRAIKRGIARANEKARAEAERAGREPSAPIPDWHPHQLRHTAATALRKEFGLDTARCILGHRSPAITEVYAELDHEKALQVVAKIG